LEIKDFIQLFILNSKIRLARGIEFRMNFIIDIVTTFGFSCTIPLFQFLIYTKVQGYPGWSFEQILLITETLFGEIRHLIENTIRNGSFDRFLVLPYQPITVILSKGFSYRSFGTMLAGGIALTYSIIRLGAILQWWHLLFFIILFVIGMLLYVSFLILYCTLTLVIINTIRFKDIFDNIVSYSLFPAEIFSAAIKLVYLTIIPIALWIYYPVQALLGRLDLYAVYGSIVSLMVFTVSTKLWKLQIKKYMSAGG
jgi:ABC-2 type transport system permease protein